MKSFGTLLVVVQLDHQRFKSAKINGIPVVYGDGTHNIMLDATEIRTARLRVVKTPDMVTAQTINSKTRRQNGELNVVERTSDSSFRVIGPNITPIGKAVTIGLTTQTPSRGLHVR